MRMFFVGSLSLAALCAQAAPFVVDASANSTGGGVGLATINLTAGMAFSVTSDSNDLWSLGPLPRWSDADGLTYNRYANGLDDSGQPIGTQIGADFGILNQGGLSAPFGSMVGRIGAGQLFLVGTNYNGVADATGTLYLYCFDSNMADNTGAITANVEAVPEPASMAILGLGLAALGRRRRK